MTNNPINIENVVKKVVRREAGAITTFIGTVREFTLGKKTLYLIYEAYDKMAIKQFEAIDKEVKEKWGDVKIAITHRVGKLEISDIAVVIAVSTPHRKDSYAANEYIISRIKEIVPIWKKEHWEDGQMWVGDQLQKKSYTNGKPEVIND
ncbi:MAG: molybdenum cofactor biosynthesis protein MoaE [Defluviitaleaceae bacterium]|nr:molybdenum cofactor biosynthesis protein MoaE [Defluviitaleaceae bacterium]